MRNLIAIAALSLLPACAISPASSVDGLYDPHDVAEEPERAPPSRARAGKAAPARALRALGTAGAPETPVVAAAGSFWDRFSHLENDPLGPDERKTVFVGGRGNVTSEGPFGLLLNPSSGTAPEGTLQAGICGATFDNGAGGSFTGVKTSITYAITDWFEVGESSLDIQNDSRGPAIGPQAKARILKDEEGSYQPEVAVGAYSNFDSGQAFDKSVIYVAGSKGWPIRKDEVSRYVKSFRVHAGVRRNWRDAGDDDTVGWFAAEIELPYYVYFMAEVSTDDNDNKGGAIHTPFAFGIQVKHPDGIGFTLAGLQPGFSADIGLYIGIGIGFTF